MSAKMPPIGDIVKYWSTREDESGLGVDWAEAHERCWRCGYKSRLQRCHIIPDSRGGSAQPENLVLLCRRCHREAPNVPDTRFMWIWIRATCVPFYNMYWTARGAEEFEEIFGRPPFTGTNFDKNLRDAALKLLHSEIASATVHWGEGRLNSSTIASVFAMVEEQLTGLPVVPPDCSVRGMRLVRAINSLMPGMWETYGAFDTESTEQQDHLGD
jgi:hypothetical protein